MSSFEKTGGKNLDEILASIRQTLADETTTPALLPVVDRSLPAGASATSASASTEPAPKKTAAGRPDDDLADLLAGSLGAHEPSPGDKDGDVNGEHKDPLWFLRPSNGRRPQALPLAGNGSPSGGPSGPGTVTKPERSNLPPLFIADIEETKSPGDNGAAALNDGAGPALTPDKPKADAKPPTSATVTAKPSAATPQDASAGNPTAPKKEDGASAKPAAPARNGEAKADMAAPLKRDEAKPAALAAAASPAGPAKPAATPAKPDEAAKPQASGTTSGSGTKAAPSSVIAPSTATTPARAGTNGATPAAAAAAHAALNGSGASLPSSQNQAMEQVIEQLLEPLLRRWVEANLPRMVEAAIRAEVARQVEKKAEPAAAPDRKV